MFPHQFRKFYLKASVMDVRCRQTNLYQGIGISMFNKGANLFQWDKNIYLHLIHIIQSILVISKLKFIPKLLISQSKFSCPRKFTLTSGPSCSKLTTSLVNVTLKFQMSISQINLSAKASLIFSTKNISVFGYKAVKHLTS